MRVRPQRDSKRPREPEIGELEVSFLVNEQVLRLEIAMQDAMRVEIIDAFNELVSLIGAIVSWLAPCDSLVHDVRGGNARISGDDKERFSWEATSDRATKLTLTISGPIPSPSPTLSM
jgi:hypothetical protein